MTQTEALRLALEALELHGKQYPHMVKGYCLDAITAIKTALSGEAQTRSVDKDEPVAWRTYTGRGYYIIDKTFEEAEQNWPDRPHSPLYTTPPQRKPLTDEEIERLWPMRPTDDVINFARAIEAAHGIKGEE